MIKAQSAVTPAQKTTLAAQVAAWRYWCTQEDEYFDPADYEIHVYQRPSGVVDLFCRCALENWLTSEPSFHLGYAYSNGTWVETTYGGDEVPFTYWDNVSPVAVTLV
jgi:hypothetical protein